MRSSMSQRKTRIRVAIVDDHRMFLDALSEWLRREEPEVKVTAAVVSWADLLMHRQFPVDVVLLDVDLKDNIPLAIKLPALHAAGVKTILMSAYAQPNTVRDALANGALSYLVKSEETETIAMAIRSAMRGESLVSEELMRSIDTEKSLEMQPLSPKERQVMALYGGGATVKDVAFQLGIAEETTKSHLKKIRATYRGAGIDIRSKIALRRRAIVDGLLRDLGI